MVKEVFEQNAMGRHRREGMVDIEVECGKDMVVAQGCLFVVMLCQREANLCECYIP